MKTHSNFLKTPFLISVMFFISSCFLSFFLLKMVNNNIAKFELKEGEWQIEVEKRDDIKALDHSIKIIESERTQLETHFARSSNVVPFLDTMEELALKAKTKAEITSVDILKNPAGFYVGMRVSGTFNNVYRFLTLLENSPYELEFEKVNMRRGAGLDEDGNNIQVPGWDAEVKVKLLTFIE